MSEFKTKFRKMIAVEKLDRTDGRRGLENLCKIAKYLGYHDTQYFGQFQGGSIGDLLEFFEDNPGAIEAVVDWIAKEGGKGGWPMEDDDEDDEDDGESN